jgi:RNA polymerase sigma-70 factor, ECF subfamily
LKVIKSSTELVVRLLKRGDMAAFDAIYNYYCHKLHEFVFMYLKQDEDAEEIVQEVFIKNKANFDKILNKG